MGELVGACVKPTSASQKQTSASRLPTLDWWFRKGPTISASSLVRCIPYVNVNDRDMKPANVTVNGTIHVLDHGMGLLIPT